MPYAIWNASIISDGTCANIIAAHPFGASRGNSCMQINYIETAYRPEQATARPSNAAEGILRIRRTRRTQKKDAAMNGYGVRARPTMNCICSLPSANAMH